MTITLAVDNCNVVDLPVYNPALIPSIARTFADKVEAGEFGEVTRAIVILETDAGPLNFYWGETPSHLEVVGLIQLALHETTQDALDSYDEE